MAACGFVVRPLARFPSNRSRKKRAKARTTAEPQTIAVNGLPLPTFTLTAAELEESKEEQFRLREDLG